MGAYSRSNAHDRGYTGAWRRARLAYLNTHPLCVYCQQAGRITAATVVDHIQPHRGDKVLFWARANWQALCQPCHDRHKAKLERSGAEALVGCGVDGMPLDPAHPWSDRGGQGAQAIAVPNAPATARQNEKR